MKHSEQPTTLAPAKTDVARGQALAAYLGSEAMRKRLASALPKHITPDRMIRMALTAVSRNPKLLACNMHSIGLALLTASQLGLEVNGRDAHLVPYKDECVLIPDYKGLIQLAYRSGIVENVSAKAVYAKDTFEYEYGTNEHLRHIPCSDDDPGPLVFAWASFRLKNGCGKFVVLNKRDIRRRQMASKAVGSENPWQKWEEAMWTKSAVRELSKWMPQMAELSAFYEAVRIEEEDGGIDTGVTMPAIAKEEVSSKAEEVAAALARRREQESEENPSEDEREEA